MPDYDDGDDRYEEYKDGVAMGYINPDGTQREPAEPDWNQVEEDKHAWQVHGGGPCDCPEPPRRTIPHDFPPIVALCGSTRFAPQFAEANLRLTLLGRIVLTIGCNLRDAADAAVAAGLGADPEQVKGELDALHRRKIDLADEVLVVTDDSGYFGESTAAEIAYANDLAKPVRYMHPEGERQALLAGLLVEPPF